MQHVSKYHISQTLSKNVKIFCFNENDNFLKFGKQKFKTSSSAQKDENYLLSTLQGSNYETREKVQIEQKKRNKT